MERSGPLVRRTGLSRGPGPRRTGGPGRAARPASNVPRAAKRETGPSDKVRHLVLVRDDFACVCCGLSIEGRPYSLQHRDARQAGGTSRPEANYPFNLLTFDGTGTTGHHGRVEHHEDPEDGPKGYRLKPGQDPEATPVWYVREFWSGWRWLTAAGELLDYDP